ncbi:MAG: hypothetical protein Q8O67_14665 [Deltaproteobacteria bacterium]|nr:hypothetical protein [Deltaproteobacteria bacterium]
MMRVVAVVVAVVGSLCGCFDPLVAADVVLSCAGADCPAPALCLQPAGLCVDPDAECIEAGGPGLAGPDADGTPCSLGVCKAGRCLPARCGDGAVSPPEECDDANDDDDDDCVRCLDARCGDGHLQRALEACDDGDDDGGDGCARGCRKIEVCGDGVVDESEGCDDSNDNPVDGCDACRVSTYEARVVVGGGPARELVLNEPTGLARDPIGRLYITDTDNHVVRRLDPDGTLTVVAGTGTAGFGGDGGPGTSAFLREPRAVAADNLGRLLIADSGNDRIRRVDVDGTIVTVAGTGERVCSGAPILGAAQNTNLCFPVGVAVDEAGRILVADSSRRLYQISTGGDLQLFAGTGAAGSAGEGGFAVDAAIGTPGAIAVNDSVFFTDVDGGRLLVITEGGNLQRLAGTGTPGPAQADGPAVLVPLSIPSGLAFDDDGAVLVVDTGNDRVLKLVGLDVVTVAAFPDLSGPRGIASDGAGGFLVAASNQERVLHVDSGGAQSVLIDGDLRVTGDGLSATSETFKRVSDVVFDALGRVVIADEQGDRVRRVELDGTISTVLGTGVLDDDSPDGFAATATGIFAPNGLAVDDAGLLHVSEGTRVRRIEADGTVRTVAGSVGLAGFSGDGGSAVAAGMTPTGIAFDRSGRLLVCGNSRLRRVELDGTIDTVVTGLTQVRGVAEDAAGRLYFTFALGGLVRLQDGVFQSLAAVAGKVTSDDEGNVLAAVEGAQVLRFDGVTGVASVVAGVAGAVDDSGDGGPALAAHLRLPGGVDVDAGGRVLIGGETLVRLIDDDGVITTVAGPLHPRGPGPAPLAQLFAPHDLLSVGAAGPVLSLGTFGRVLGVQAGNVAVVVGYDLPALSPLARFAETRAYLAMAWDDVGRRVFILDQSGLAVVDVDVDDDGVVDDPARWTAAHAVRRPDTYELAGLAYDPSSDTLVVADTNEHCVRRLNFQDAERETVLGVCGARGSFEGFLDSPSDVVVGPLGVVYVSDTLNNRVFRVDDDGPTLVLGDGSRSSGGEGSPAAGFPVDSPGQLALDSRGNLFLTSRTTVRAVVNVDGDDDADGDDRVITVFGRERAAFPESLSLCLSGLTLVDDERLQVADSCQGFMVELTRN